MNMKKETGKRYTLAQLKRDSTSGALSIRIAVTRDEKLKSQDINDGMRPLVDADNKGIYYLDRSGNKVLIPLPVGTLIDYYGGALFIFDAGERPLNDDERDFLSQWYEYKKSLNRNFDMEESGAYNEVRNQYFTTHGYPYLCGNKKFYGKIYSFTKNLVVDDTVRGNLRSVFKIAPKSECDETDEQANARLREEYRNYISDAYASKRKSVVSFQEYITQMRIFGNVSASR